MQSFIKKNFLVIHKALCLVMASVLCISAMITGTFAWKDAAQHRSAPIIKSDTMFYSVLLNKFEKDGSGSTTVIPVANAEFYLYQQVGDAPDPNSDTQIGTQRYLTSAEGRISVEGLLPGTYYFIETDPGYGYEYDQDSNGNPIDIYPFTVQEEQEASTVFVTAYNRRLSADLTITKTVHNENGAELTEEQKETEFTFTVSLFPSGMTPDTKAYDYTIFDESNTEISTGKIRHGGTIMLKHGQKAVIHNLPVNSVYRVVEAPMPNYAITSQNHAGSIPLKGAQVEYTNTFHAYSCILAIEKEVTGIGHLSEAEQAAVRDTEFSFLVSFFGGGEYAYRIIDIATGIAGAEQLHQSGGIIKLKPGQRAEFSGLPQGLPYTVQEMEHEGFTSTPTQYQGMVGEGTVILPFINHKTSDAPDPNGSLSITKEVTGTGADPAKEFEFTVTFDKDGTYHYRIDGGALTPHTNGGVIRLRHGQVARFEDVPIHTRYTITEADYTADGYIATVKEVVGIIGEGESSPLVTFVNHKHNQKLSLLKVSKKVEGEPPASDANKEFWFTVTINGVVTRFSLKSGEVKEFELPLGAVYEVVEDDYTGDGYDLTQITNAYGNAIYEVIEVVCINTYTGTVMIDLAGEKTWDMTADPGYEKPAQITVYLKDGNRIVETMVVEPDGNGEWNYTFHAPKYRPDGVTPIHYTVEEVPLPGFVTEVNGMDIKNTYYAPISYVPVVEKSVIGDKPESDSSFVFLLSSGKAPLPDETKLTITGAQTGRFDEIKFTEPGVYTYYIAEATGNAEGYTYDRTIYTLTVLVQLEGNQLVIAAAVYAKDGEATTYDKAVFVNQYKQPDELPPPPPPTDEMVTISGRKIWNHGDNPVDRQPTSIVAYVLANGNRKISFALDGKSHWQYAFILPKYDKDGKEIVYTVAEEPIGDYTSVIDGYNIINSHKSYDPAIGSDPSTVPQTGDNRNVRPWVYLMIASGGTLSLLVWKRPGANKKRRR